VEGFELLVSRHPREVVHQVAEIGEVEVSAFVWRLSFVVVQSDLGVGEIGTTLVLVLHQIGRSEFLNAAVGLVSSAKEIVTVTVID
jgi:hypothetical protein